ncbi:hypothetical protein JVU11DRAFT_10975 [Chiua virens]|nr:hypothetical protein JVU11DRAFT_10975 [Chiua virens]
MQQILPFIRRLLSAVRRLFPFSSAVLRLIQILTALKQFVQDYFGPPGKVPRVSTSSSEFPGLSSTVSNPDIQSAQTPYHCVTSSLPARHHGLQQEMVQVSQEPITPEVTLPAVPEPFAPGWFERYEHRRPVERKPNKDKIKAGQTSFLEKVPDHWERVVHPEGARYYFNANKNVFTDAGITELGDLSAVDACVQFLRERESQLVSSNDVRSRPTQLVIQLTDSEQWVYYFVDHDARVVFWVEDFDLEGLIPSNILGVTEDSHIVYAIEVQYWQHCELYPNSIPLLQEHITEMWGAMSFAYIAPLSPLNQNELAKILSLMPYLQARVPAADIYAIWILARAMRILARAKLYHFYGQPGARLEADMSVYSPEGDHKDGGQPIAFFCDFCFFFALSSHIQALKSIWVDENINYAQWSKFSTKLTAEWNGFAIYSTVMLAVDISFLSVPSVNKGNVNSQSVAIVATYMSLLCVVGSLVSSVLLSGKITAMETSAEVAMFMQKMTHWKGGIFVLGIICSLPFALVLWSMVFFALALVYTIFQSTDTASLGIMTCGTVMVSFALSLPVWWGRDYGSFPEWLLVLNSRSQQTTGQQESV